MPFRRLFFQRAPGRYPAVGLQGILDSYRREKGLNAPIETTSAPSVSPGDSHLPLPEAHMHHGLAEDLELEDAVAYTDDDTPCPVDCVLEVFDSQELQDILASVAPSTLVVVDFYKTACGACKYIQPGFVKLCKAISSEAPSVVFVKHNVYDDDAEELTDLARQRNIRSVPMFKFFKAQEEVESFATRDKKRLAHAINMHVGADTVVL